MNVPQSVVKPVLTFSKWLKSIGVFLVALAVAIIGIPFKLPAYVVSVAEYLALVGAVMIVVVMATRNLDKPGVKSKTGTRIRSPG
jgi:uncharacterized membrane protein